MWCAKNKVQRILVQGIDTIVKEAGGGLRSIRAEANTTVRLSSLFVIAFRFALPKRKSFIVVGPGQVASGNLQITPDLWKTGVLRA